MRDDEYITASGLRVSLYIFVGHDTRVYSTQDTPKPATVNCV